MLLTLTREILTEESTIGSLSIDNNFECFTLEDKVRPFKLKGQTAIPAGKYPVQITMSNKFQRMLPLLIGVPEFAGIRIHPGNTAGDTEGCILVGRTRGKNVIGNSRAAFQALFEKLSHASEGSISIEIANPVSGGVPPAPHEEVSATVVTAQSLRGTPDGKETEVGVRVGDTVDVVATQGLWAQVKVLGDVDAPLGWLPSSALSTSPSDPVIDRAAFAAECRRQSSRFEAYGVYLAAVALLRSGIANDRQDNLIGPFRLSEREWDFFCGDPELGEDANGDITNWRAQCAVFALMCERSVDALADELQIDSGLVTPTKLYLAQMIGPSAAAQLINNPALPVDPSNINNVPGLPADPDVGPELLQRYGQFLSTNGNPALGKDILARISTALGPPIITVRPLVVPPTAPGTSPPPEPKLLKGDDLFKAKAPTIMRDLIKDFGIDKMQAAAILGNIGHECGGFKLMQEQNPRAGRGGFGWCQWTGSRRVNFENFCAQRNMDIKSDQANYSFLRSELIGPYNGAMSKLAAAPDLNAAVIAFEGAFERAARDVKYYDRRERYARMALACVP